MYLIGKDFSIWIFFLGTDSYILKAFFAPFLLVKKNPIHCKKSYLLESKTYYVYK